MEHSRKQKLLVVLVLVVAIASLSIGFAAFSTTLNISSSASVTPNSDSFSVKFSTVASQLSTGPIVAFDISSETGASHGIIDNSAAPTVSNFKATFKRPGQYVEYYFYARNEGEYTAYLNSVNFLGNKTCTGASDTTDALVQSACESINIFVTIDDLVYSETTAVSSHALETGKSNLIKVRLEYASNGSYVDGEFAVTFPQVSLLYSSVDDSAYIPPESDKTLLMDIVKEGAILDTDVDFKVAPNTGTYIFNSTSSDVNPIYYYRGAVTNNNVKFANFCWKIVRTTETGGVKLIYNGVPAGDGSCNNTGTASQIGTSTFNSTRTSPAYVGYMYGTVYTASSKTLTDQTDTYIYGNDIAWNGTNYTLVDTMSSSSWTTDYKTLATKYHYTCFNDTGICENVYYINYYYDKSTAYYLTLTEGKNIEKAKEEMFINTTDSKIKTKIDNWYKTNMTSYTSKLEDTVWCNDRTLASGPLLSKDTNGIATSYFAAYNRNEITFKPSVTCANARDSFTVGSNNGNGKLTYPVGLLTADEITMAGSGNIGYSNSAYLHTGNSQWSLSPFYFNFINAGKFLLNSSGSLNSGFVNITYGVRPSVSLKPGTYVSSGDGTSSKPYIIE